MALAEAAKIYSETFFKALQPDDVKQTISDWADENRWLSSKASAEPGRWKTARTPYLRAIMDSLSPQDPIQRICFMKGAQIGATEAGSNWIGYCIDLCPAPMMMVQPTVDMLKRLSKQRLDPMIQESPCLAKKVAEARSRDSGSTMFSKEFPGGFLLLTGANSAVGLRSAPIRFLFLDEVDGFPGDADGEGDPVDLAIARTRTFRKRKIFLVSTPTTAGQSRIEFAFDESDQRYFYLPCPDCGGKQHLKFANLRWEKGKPETAAYACEHCGVLIEEHNKTNMLAAGEWIAHKPENKKMRGFHISSLYSPLGWYSWEDAATDFETAKKDPSKLKTFVNTVLGECWEDKGEQPDWEKLYKRRLDYDFNTIPEGVLFLTAGVDIQRDRIEAEIVGWGRDYKTWSIDYRVYKGDTTQPSVWKKLADMINETWKTEAGGELKILQCAVDSSDQTQRVYNWVRLQADDRIMAIKGHDSSVVIVGQPKQVDINFEGKKIYRGVKYWPVGVSKIKEELYGWLRQETPLEKTDDKPIGWAEFPQYDKDIMRGLTAEKRVVKMIRGSKKIVHWIKVFERNEPLDCRVYARAAAFVIGIDRFKEEHWKQLEEAIAKPIEIHHDIQKKPERRKSDWL